MKTNMYDIYEILTVKFIYTYIPNAYVMNVYMGLYTVTVYVQCYVYSNIYGMDILYMSICSNT